MLVSPAGDSGDAVQYGAHQLNIFVIFDSRAPDVPEWLTNAPELSNTIKNDKTRNFYYSNFPVDGCFIRADRQHKGKDPADKFLHGVAGHINTPP